MIIQGWYGVFLIQVFENVVTRYTVSSFVKSYGYLGVLNCQNYD